MLACATISKNEYECPGDSLRDLLDASNSKMQDKFEQAQQKYAEDIAAAKEQAAEMAEEMAAMKEDMATVVQALRDAVPEHNDLTTLPLLDVPVPCSGSDDCQFPNGYFDFDDNLFDADVELPDYDAMGEKMQARVDAYEASLARARAEANLDTSHLRESINEVGDELFDDYDPPSVRTEEERSKHNDATEEFKQDSAVSLEQFDRIGEKNESKGYTPSFGGNFSLPDVKGFDLNWFTYLGRVSDAVDGRTSPPHPPLLPRLQVPRVQRFWLRLRRAVRRARVGGRARDQLRHDLPRAAHDLVPQADLGALRLDGAAD